ncbi:reverse transcriptase domain-containing protein [Tanacetum coccineum]
MAEVLISSLDASNPLFLQANDHSNMPIVGFKLTGFDNYKMWSNAMKIALKGINKRLFSLHRLVLGIGFSFGYESFVCGRIERGFLSQKGSEGGRGVEEKNLNRNTTNTTTCIGLCTKSDSTMNEDTPVGVASAAKEVVTPSVVNMTMEKEK